MSKKAVARAKNASTKHSTAKWIIVASSTVGALVVAAVVVVRRQS